jgi:hypothetical protein
VEAMKAFLLSFLASFVGFSLAATPAEPIAFIDAGDRVLLYAEQGACPEGSRRAIYIMRAAPQKPIAGCYIIRTDVVWMFFEDGDRGGIKVDRFTWAQGFKPGAPL